MALAPKYADAAVNAEADAIARLLDNGYLRLYGGGSGKPSTADTEITDQTLLAELRFASTSAPAAVAGLLTFNAITSDASANADGTVTWARCLKSDGTTEVMDGTVGTVSGFDFIINSTAIASGARVDCTGLTFQAAKG